MANVTRNSGAGEAVRAKKRELRTAIRAQQRECDHKNRHGACLESVHTTGEYIKDRNKLGENVVICKECHDIFDLTTFTAEEIEDAVSTLKSMINQIKVVTNMDDAEYADIVKLLEFMDDKIDGVLVPYYITMIKRLGSDGRRKNNESSSKGRIGGLGGSMGVNSRSFN